MSLNVGVAMVSGCEWYHPTNTKFFSVKVFRISSSINEVNSVSCKRLLNGYAFFTVSAAIDKITQLKNKLHSNIVSM